MSDQDDTTATARAMVRQLVIEPLREMGLRRPAGVTVDGHKAELDQLVQRLAYLDGGELEALREAVLDLAGAGGRWPRLSTVLAQARSIRPAPPGFDPKVVRYMRSAAGRRASEGGYAGPLLTWLCRNPGVPSDYSLGKIREQADDETRRRVRLRERLAADCDIAPDDRRWLEGTARRDEQARALVEGRA